MSQLSEWQRLRNQLDAQDNQVLERLVNAYGGSYTRIDPHIQALVEKTQADIDAGKLTQESVKSSAAYKNLLRAVRSELDDFEGYLKTEIRAASTAAARSGLSAGSWLILAAMADALGVDISKAPRDLVRQAGADALSFLVGYLDKLKDRIDELSNYHSEQIATGILERVTLGQNPRIIAEWITDAYGMGLTDSVRMTRTAQLYSHRQAANAVQVANADILEGVVWCAELDDRVCMSCVSLHGQLFPVGTIADDHHNGRAEVPGNMILADDTTALETIWHDGNIVIISTASGKFLAVTPNHPVLTRRGWIAAKFIQRGDNVISAGRANWAPFDVRPDDNHIPTRVENIPQALNMLRLGSVPESAENFYRHGPDGQVDTVFIDRLLWRNMDSASRKQIKEYFFGSRHTGANFSSFCRLYHCFLASLYPPCGLLRGGNSGFSFSGCHPGGHNYSGFGRSPMMYFIFRENAGYNSTGDAITKRNRQLGMPGLVKSANMRNIYERESDFAPTINGNFTALDLHNFGGTPEQPLSLQDIREGLFGSMPLVGGACRAITSEIILDSVINVDFRRFSGHVYSLQTRKGWYYSNGIISHNCAMLPIVKGGENPITQTGADWFAEQSESTQKDMMGAAKWDAWQAGKFEFSQLSKTYDDEIYGTMRSEASLKSLLGDGQE